MGEKPAEEGLSLKRGWAGRPPPPFHPMERQWDIGSGCCHVLRSKPLPSWSHDPEWILGSLSYVSQRAQTQIGVSWTKSRNTAHYSSTPKKLGPCGYCLERIPEALLCRLSLFPFSPVTECLFLCFCDFGSWGRIRSQARTGPSLPVGCASPGLRVCWPSVGLQQGPGLWGWAFLSWALQCQGSWPPGQIKNYQLHSHNMLSLVRISLGSVPCGLVVW